ncbi:hypothetical protein Pla100_29320 [Neorhodopirellula pilleata]|uniref:Uncharacterized protein n=1 Tax=Neorhodopirellula pilleata TaxID=2714738 RepID=A0A5C6A8Y8_9BACT|nr:hypothetical protein Pla100_29320 [Neorhodopirellula pilleata]
MEPDAELLDHPGLSIGTYLRLQPTTDGTAYVLRPNIRRLILAASIPLASIIPCIFIYSIVPMPGEQRDIQMRWIAAVASSILFLIGIWRATAWTRFRATKLGVRYEPANDRIVYRCSDSTETFDRRDVLGLQVIRDYTESQLNLLVSRGDGLARRLLHHGSHQRINDLVADFSRFCGIEVVSETSTRSRNG